MKYTTINIQGNLISEEILQKLESGEAHGQKVTDFGFEPGANIRSEIEYAWSRIKLDWKHFFDKSQNLSVSDPYGTTLSRKWMEQFLSSIGFELSKPKTGLQGDNNQSYTISHVADNLSQLPVHIVGFIEPNNPDKNTLDVKTSGGTSRFSPHATMQEYLNVTEHVYGIAANGMFLRLIRDSGRLIKLTYVEFDLKRMLDEDKYSEFTLLYRLLHATRFPRTQAEADQCFLEKYYQDSIETGNRIRDGLSLAVKESLLALGNGFLQHESNAELREKIQSGQLSSKNYYRQLLRIIYRFLFLMVTEERDLVYNPDDKTEETQRLKKVYLQFYSIARLRKLCENRYVYERQFNDLWQGLVQTFQLFEAGGNGKKLGIKPLDGDLFSYNAIQDLQECLINNKLLLECVRNMNEFRDEKKNLVNINYRSLDVEELGSVYEGLLELHPVIENIEASNSAHIIFTFHEGTDRKTTGSYYTRPELVNELIKSALIPVIEERLKEQAGNKEAQAKALLKLKVCDAAAGSGHMLLAAARTIAWYLARVQSGEENPAPSVYRSCLREVIQHCIYAVDFNPDAVELCKLALWLEGHNSGKPLSFLDHKIRNGNSLVGVSDLSVLQKGVPDNAFNPVTGDDKKVCQELKKENAKYNKTKQTTLDFDQSGKIDTTTLTGDYKELENIRQDDVEGVKQVKTKFDKLRSNHAWFNDWRACNLWTAAFFWNYTEENKQAAPNSERLAKFLQNPAAAYGPMIGKADALSMEHKFFHWPLEFPDVFEQGGFDVMLGNPPWERIKLQEQEFFSTKDSNVAKAKTAAERKKLIKLIESNNPKLFSEFILACRTAEVVTKFIRFSTRFPLTARGDINTYTIFTEHARNICNSNSRTGLVVPSGIATDETTSIFFSDIVNNYHLVSLYGFENEGGLFPSVMHNFKFALLTLSRKKTMNPDLAFSIWYIEELKNDNRHFTLSREDFELLNPSTRTSPLFKYKEDAEITKFVYKNNITLGNFEGKSDAWSYKTSSMLHMTNDSQNFKTEDDLCAFKKQGNKYLNYHETYLPVYEAKMIYFYDHRYASALESKTGGLRGSSEYTTDEQHKNPDYRVQPRFWVKEKIILNQLENKSWLIGFRGITGSVVNIRTTIFSIIPAVGVGNTMPLIDLENCDVYLKCCFLANMNSLILDYITRQKLGGTALNFFILNQLPVIPPSKYGELKIQGQLAKHWIAERVLELTFTSSDLKGFASDYGYNGLPYNWDVNKRELQMRELDAAFAILYGLNLDQLKVILNHFRSLEKVEVSKFGEFRTRRLVLEAWERLNNNEN